MLRYNSVTDKYEDDGKDLPEMDSVKLASGRLANPDGSQDINIPVYADLLKRERLNSKEIGLDMQANPDAYPFGNLVNLSKPSMNEPTAGESSGPSKPQPEMNPLVKDYLMKKMGRAPQGNAASDNTNVETPTSPMVTKPNPFSDEERNKVKSNMESRQGDLALAQLASSFGDALARKDSSGTQNYFNGLRANIKDETLNDFDKRKKQSREDVVNKRQDDMYDPNSSQSMAFKKIIEAQFPQIAKSFGNDWANVAAADQENIFKPLQLKEQIEARKQTAQMAYDLKKSELEKKNSPEQRLQHLSGTDKARYDNALMAIKGLDEMAKALDGGQNTFSMIGDNDYTAASRRATEAYGRMQSGGAINKEEESKFEKTLPGKTDSKDIQRKKLVAQREEMVSRLKTLGFTPEQVGIQPLDFKYGSSNKSKDSKPKQITQNGHTYILNESTGEYE